MRRRSLLAAVPVLPALPAGVLAAAGAVQPRPLRFPRDHGAHPAYRTEWWYATGELHSGDATLGFQLTFFRRRNDAAQSAQGRFAARQLLFAHAALSDPLARRLLHDERIARWSGDPAAPLAAAALDDTRVHLGAWRLQREGGRYRIAAEGRDFGLALELTPTQPLLLQGEAGYSRKGPAREHASHYYSLPQLGVQGTVRQGARRLPVQGTAWLDHEWSGNILPPEAVGWDWIGMNLDDGSALTAFRVRRRDGSALWAGGSWRGAGQVQARPFGAQEVRFTPLRHWTSPATQATYPVEWRLSTPAGEHRVRARFDAQEIDARRSTGTVYWEGLSDLQDDAGRRVGRGYLEMTGYAGRLQL